jgi:rhodanese-related sulfurtransferase
MKTNHLLLIFILFITTNICSSKFLSRSFFSKPSLSFIQITGKTLKKYINNKEYYLIDTREMATIAQGFIPNSLIVPSTMFSFLYAVVPEGSKVIIISDETNYITTLDSFVALGKYKLIGYCIYDKIIQEASFNIQVVQYDPNTFESITKIVEEKQHIIDIREISEFKDTGVIKEAQLIPISTFLKDYKNIPSEGNVYVFCKSGGRATIGMSFMKRAGYLNKFIVMKGGMTQAIQEGYPVVPYEG